MRRKKEIEEGGREGGWRERLRRKEVEEGGRREKLRREGEVEEGRRRDHQKGKKGWIKWMATQTCT